MTDQAPLWLIGLLLFAAMILAYEGGMRLHDRIRRRDSGPEPISGENG